MSKKGQLRAYALVRSCMSLRFEISKMMGLLLVINHVLVPWHSVGVGGTQGGYSQMHDLLRCKKGRGKKVQVARCCAMFPGCLSVFVFVFKEEKHSSACNRRMTSCMLLMCF